MNRVENLVIFLLGLVSSGAFGADYYRARPSYRYMGFDQGNVGSCQAEAEVAALESVFVLQGLGVQLSSFYRHARNWTKDPTANSDTMLRFQDEDYKLLDQMGGILPDYMWPEDAAGYDPYHTGLRPHPSQAAVIDPSFPNAESLGFGAEWFSFQAGFSNSRNMEHLKSEVASGKAVTLSLHGALLSRFFDHQTGMLKDAYSWEAFEQQFKKTGPGDEESLKKPRHAVAVVGWDDSLYDDDGAIIIRNSWNNASVIQANGLGPFSEKTASRLNRFKFKLSPGAVIPGYYAIPYRYIRDLQARGLGGFTVLSLDFQAYAKEYARHRKDYEVLTVPYVCEFGRFWGARQRLSRSAREKTEKLGRLAKLSASGRVITRVVEKIEPEDVLHRLVESETRSRKGGVRKSEERPAFNFARLSRNRRLGIDRALEFYQGKLSDYYCDKLPSGVTPEASVWPKEAAYRHPGFQEAVQLLSANPYSFQGWFSFLLELYETGAYRE